MSQSAIATLVERTSRYLRLVHLPDGHRADQLLAALEPVLDQLPNRLRLTLTWDQGSEMARHAELAGHFTDGIYFAHPASPWLRGTNENTAPPVLSKGSNLRAHGPAVLRAVEDRLNNRPRPILGWRTPADVFAADLSG